MLGPRIEGRGGVSLRPPTLEDQRLYAGWLARPETTRFWAPRQGNWSEERLEERFKKSAADRNSVSWSIAYRAPETGVGEAETVGFIGLFDIDWVSRDCESGIFVGRHDLYGRGIATEAVRLRTVFAWEELRLHRVHNWIALANRGSRRANEKAGYRQIGLLERYGYRSGEWLHDWVGEIFPGPDGPESGRQGALNGAIPESGDLLRFARPEKGQRRRESCARIE
ncbi:MAG: GNAT family N-acetyltransferase [Candidatus Limnocylindria bacterium]